ncbi:MAG: asparagine synthase (glutamine-hydrolyzing), partial [Bacteroidales bacterium]|nr:asparagine synthase (glutamine-hydrolyzing) [Bacteroidales bacterium]
MGGITGVLAYSEEGRERFSYVENALNSLNHRGKNILKTNNTGSIIIAQTSNKSKLTSIQDTSNRYALAFSGNLYNANYLKSKLQNKAIKQENLSEQEILLHLLISEKENCLEKIEGNFSLAFLDKEENSLLIARDRFGINPLAYYKDKNNFIFASETKALLQYNIPKELNYNSVYLYFKLNYIPGDLSILKNTNKLKAGHYIKISKNNFRCQAYYSLPNYEISEISYDEAIIRSKELIKYSIEKRINSVNNLGFFLSGGIDSSIITAHASEILGKIKTFSLGYANNAFYDETHYANLVAKKFNTEHKVFKITNQDFIEQIPEVFDAIDEPFADSSAIAFYILSKQVKQHIDIAFSGDGADEIFTGYNKHTAHYKAINPKFHESFVSKLNFLWRIMPQSRNNKLSNAFRQLNKFSEGRKLSPEQRYFEWASFANDLHCNNLIKYENINKLEIEKEKEDILKYFKSENEILEILYSDVSMVLQNDMLVKVDLMASKNGLKIRTPFLDTEVFDFAIRLPIEYKINSKIKKKILQDAYKDILPKELYNRPKQGFEVPL